MSGTRPAEAEVDISRVIQELHLPSKESLVEMTWLRASHQEPETFTEQLLRFPGLAPPLPRKSQLSVGIDLYADLVRSYASAPQTLHRAALRWHDVARGLQTLSYLQLHEQASVLSRHLQASDCQPGSQLAIVLPPGPDIAVALCAGLKLGLQLVIVPPYGPRFIARRLRVLGNVPVWTLPRYRRLLEGSESRALPPQGPALPAERDVLDAESVTYKPADPVLGLFSPVHEQSAALVAVSASQLYSGAARDALLLGVTADRGIPKLLFPVGCDPIQHFTALFFAAVSSGACYLHCEDEALKDYYQVLAPVLERHAVTMASLGDEPRFIIDLLQRGVLPLPSRLIISPFATRLLRGSSALQRSPLERLPVSLLHLDSASGGGVLFSTAHHGGLRLPVYVAPACSHRLESPSAPGVPTTQQSGRLRLVALPEAADGGLLLSRLSRDEEYFLAGTLRARRSGRTYPSEEVRDLVDTLPGVHGTAVVEVAAHGHTRFLLLVFSHFAAAITGQVERVISQQLGVQALPDSIEQLSLYPRRNRGEVDQVFYQTSYSLGMMQRLQQDPVLSPLSTLRGFLTRLREVPKS